MSVIRPEVVPLRAETCRSDIMLLIEWWFDNAICGICVCGSSFDILTSVHSNGHDKVCTC